VPSCLVCNDDKTFVCPLVTEKDVTSTIGTDPGKGSAFSSHGATQCQYGSFQTALLR
jgi:hypothetical protein